MPPRAVRTQQGQPYKVFTPFKRALLELIGDSEGVATWLNELIWREFYLYVLAQFPRVSMHRPLLIETGNVYWRHDEKDFDAWCNGRTGFPLVDLKFARERALLAFA